MFSLILTVISISLVASLTFATITYLPGDEPIKQQVAERTTDGFQALERAWHSYQQENRSYSWTCETYTGPSTGEVFEDCERTINSSGVLPESNWQSELFPAHGFEPQPPATGAWSYTNDGSGNIYFCLADNFDPSERAGIARAERAFSSARFVVADVCGAVTDQDLGTSYAGSVAVTYWIERDTSYTPGSSVANSCLGSNTAGTIGPSGSKCDGLLIVTRADLDAAVQSGESGGDYGVVGPDSAMYTLANSTENVYVGQITDMSGLFLNSWFNGDLDYWDTSAVTNMESMFRNSDFDSDISSWDTAAVQSMDSMFDSSLFGQNIAAWATANVTSCTDFAFASDLTASQIPNFPNCSP